MLLLSHKGKNLNPLIRFLSTPNFFRWQIAVPSAFASWPSSPRQCCLTSLRALSATIDGL